MARRPWSGAVAAAFVVISAAPLPAQQQDLSIEVGGSSVSPPAGMEGEDARFVVAGLRALHFNSGGSGFSGSFLVGRTLEEGTGGDFLSGTLEGRAFRHLADGWSAGLELSGFGFRVADPFPYRSLGVGGRTQPPLHQSARVGNRKGNRRRRVVRDGTPADRPPAVRGGEGRTLAVRRYG